MMDLLDRYLNTIRWNLPRGTNELGADDILAELRDVIGNRIEEREDALGRALTKDETSALLQEFGHPLVVAARYGTQQWLIGPDIFPFYLFALKVIVAISAAIELIQGLGRAVLSGEALFAALPHAANGLLWTLLANAGLVTLVFAVVERTGWLTEHLQRWKPEQLPDLPALAGKPNGAWHHATGAAFGIAFLLWWAGAVELPGNVIDGRHPSIQLTAVWQAFHWPIMAIVALRVVEDLTRLLRPRWRTLHSLLAIVATLATIAIVLLLIRGGPLVSVTMAGADEARAREVADGINQALPLGLAVLAAVLTISCLVELWRLARAR